MNNNEKKYKIYYLCLSPKLSLKNKSHSSVVHITETINALRANGHNVITNLKEFSDSEISDNLISQSKSGKNILPGFLKYLLRDFYLLFYNFRMYFKIKRIILREKPDFIYERITDFSFAPYFASKKTNIPLLIESNAPPEEQKNSKTNSFLFFLNKWINIFVIKRCSVLITVSSSLLDYYKNITKRNKYFYYLPNAVNLNTFNFENLFDAKLKNILGINSEVVIGFIGNVRAYHDTNLMIDVAKKILTENYNFKFLLITGDDLNTDEFKNKIRNEKLDDYFIFHKPLINKEIPEIIDMMDICILPNFSWYGSPMKIFEYAAMKKPIVAPDIQPLTDVFINNDSALLTEKGNTDEIAKGIIYLLKNPEIRKSLGENAYLTVKNNNTWEINAERIINFYEEFMKLKLNIN